MSSIESETLTNIINQSGRFRPLELQRGDFSSDGSIKLPGSRVSGKNVQKQNFVQALHGDELADRADMSRSTFRQHFRALTGISALQSSERNQQRLATCVAIRTGS